MLERNMRIYQADIHLSFITLNESNRHYLIHVMRSQLHDFCYVFDGKGLEVKAKISHITKKEVILTVIETIPNNNESPLNLHLFQAFCKGEKMDWIMQKSVELGVSEITPIITDRCDVKINEERLAKKYDHFRNIFIHACAQSGRSVLPKLNPALSLRQAIENNTASFNILFTPQGKKTLTQIKDEVLNMPEKVAIFIGPEGGFSETEICFSKQAGFHLACLGKRILRTETAPLAAIVSLQLLWGDFI